MVVEVFKSNGSDWFVTVDTPKERRDLFKLIGQRQKAAVYFMPDGRKLEEYALTVKEVNMINAKQTP